MAMAPDAASDDRVFILKCPITNGSTLPQQIFLSSSGILPASKKDSKHQWHPHEEKKSHILEGLPRKDGEEATLINNWTTLLQGLEYFHSLLRPSVPMAKTFCGSLGLLSLSSCVAHPPHLNFQLSWVPVYQTACSLHTEPLCCL